MVQRSLFLASAGVAFVLALASSTVEHPVKIAVLGDSLTVAFEISEQEAFPAQLQRALTAKGHSVQVTNASVSGDTASAGLARLDQSIPEGTEAVILELGTNDALRGVAPNVTRAALEKILRRLVERGINVLICGARAPREPDADYAHAFDAIFPEIARTNGQLFYAFFLDGVAGDSKLTIDGLHPNAAGVAEVVKRLLPKVEELVVRVRAHR